MLISSSSNISDEFSVKEGILLSIILGNETNRANDYKYKEDGEKEFN